MLGLWYNVAWHGCAQDYDRAAEWYSKSHNAGNPSGTADLGVCYFYGTRTLPKSEILEAALLCGARQPICMLATGASV